MNSRLFHLQGAGCKIVNCTQVAKNKKILTKLEDEKRIGIDESCLEVYTKVVIWFSPYAGHHLFLPQQSLYYQKYSLTQKLFFTNIYFGVIFWRNSLFKLD